jgi:hypothetical protein
MKTAVIVILALVFTCAALCTSSPTSAQLIGDAKCQQLDFVAGRIDQLLRPLGTIGAAVEKVPPAEAEYIREEKRLALEQNNMARFNLIFSHRFYHPLDFHDDFDVVAENLRAARSAKDGKNVARYLVVALSRLGSLSESVKAYIDFDRSRQPPVLSEDKRKELFLLLPLIKGQTTSLLQCVISQL